MSPTFWIRKIIRSCCFNVWVLYQCPVSAFVFVSMIAQGLKVCFAHTHVYIWLDAENSITSYCASKLHHITRENTIAKNEIISIVSDLTCTKLFIKDIYFQISCQDSYSWKFKVVEEVRLPILDKWNKSNKFWITCVTSPSEG